MQSIVPQNIIQHILCKYIIRTFFFGIPIHNGFQAQLRSKVRYPALTRDNSAIPWHHVALSKIQQRAIQHTVIAIYLLWLPPPHFSHSEHDWYTPHVYLSLSKLFRTFCPHVMQIFFCSLGSTPPLNPKTHPPPSPPPPPTPPSESLIESQLPWNKIGDWSGGNPVMQRRVGGRGDRERWEGGDTDRWRDTGWQRDWEWEREHRTLRKTR